MEEIILEGGVRLLKKEKERFFCDARRESAEGEITQTMSTFN